MPILGLNYAFHDTSACLVGDDGQLLCAMEEERFTRQKHTQSFPINAIEHCLLKSGITLRQIDHIAVSINPSLNVAEKLSYWSELPDSTGFEEYEFKRLYERNKIFVDWVRRIRSATNKVIKIHFVDHHLCHSIGSYLVSPWNEAALLSLDGWGEWGTTWLGHAEDLSVTGLRQSFFPDSLGAFYSAATEYCGFQPNYDEGKTMGLAPTGDPTRFAPVVRGMISTENGLLKLNNAWFDFPQLTGRFYGEKFAEEFGKPRRKGDDIQSHHRDLAAAAQLVLEECALDLCQYLQSTVKSKNLVISGGVALNSVMNGRILKEKIFEDLYVMPAAGDSGTSIGAAYYVHNKVLNNEVRFHHNNPFIGTTYDDEEYETTLRQGNIRYSKPPNLLELVVEILQEGGIVGWFQGPMEFGPRSLGSRSILANPAIPEMKNILNARVKRREEFRPFAPAVPDERLQDYFDLKVTSPFMLKVCDVLPEARHLFPAAVHVDGSARVQTVDRSINQKFYDLLTTFGQRTGCPVLLNTSFNIMGEPIVESPDQALRCFYTTGLDALVMGSFLVRK